MNEPRKADAEPPCRICPMGHQNGQLLSYLMSDISMEAPSSDGPVRTDTDPWRTNDISDLNRPSCAASKPY